ncbi:MAG TPA: hypothetical protein VK524_27090 [Polyangiaceae bacterium]|nr:hypothetical protein [Polyangiaceae bacterium]
MTHSGLRTAVVETLFRATLVLATSWLCAACISENAVAVDGKNPCTAGACSSGGADGGGSAGSGGSDAGGTGGAGGRDASDSDLPPFTLLVDTPDNRSTVRGLVTVSGRTSGFLNVEVWDAEHQHPPLSQTFPNPDGTFQTSVDTYALAPGETTWTVFAWDSPPGEPYAHSATVTLRLNIEAPLP